MNPTDEEIIAKWLSPELNGWRIQPAVIATVRHFLALQQEEIDKLKEENKELLSWVPDCVATDNAISTEPRSLPAHIKCVYCGFNKPNCGCM